MGEPKSSAFQKTEFFILCALTLLACVLFRNSSLDLWAAKLFYHPENLTNPWFEEEHTLWLFFYYAAPWLTGILLLGSLSVLFLSNFRSQFRVHRSSAIFVIFVFLVGSGFVINTILKPYWGRPRPREVIELGGQKKFLPFYQPNFASGGKSFPCGHCSVGFSYGLFWWILRRKKPKLAASFLAGSVVLGALMGVGRIAAGGHFFSDVVWAGLIVYWVCYGLYYYGLKIPARETILAGENRTANPISLGRKKSATVVGVYSALGLITVMVLLIASPFHKEYSLRAESPVDGMELVIDSAQVKLEIDEQQTIPYLLKGSAVGFAFPGSEVQVVCGPPAAKLQCQIQRKGLFSDYENSIELKINPRLVQSLRLILQKGEILRPTGVSLPDSFEMIEVQVN